MPDPAPAKVLFLTAGSGVTPVMSMLRTLARHDQITDVEHVHSAPTEADALFGAELAELAAAHPGYRLRLARYTAPFDLSGHPTLTLPSGFTAAGLPLAGQLVAGALREDLLVRAGRAFQRVTDFHQRRPRLNPLE